MTRNLIRDSQRRWLKQANPALSQLITETIGDAWVTDLEAIRELVPYAEDETFREACPVRRRSYGDIYRDRFDKVDEVFGRHFRQQPSFSGIDKNRRKVPDRFLHINPERFFQPHG
jgi:carbohydrate phosphorylase